MSNKFNPSLMIMAKTVGFDYLDTTQVMAVQRAKGGAAASAETVTADDAKITEVIEELPAPESMPHPEQELLKFFDPNVPRVRPKTKLLGDDPQLDDQGNLKLDEKNREKRWAYHKQGYRNILSVYEQSTQDEIAAYKDWYQHAHNDCKTLAEKLKSHLGEIDEDPTKVMIGVVAASSQGTLWEANLALAERLIVERELPKGMKITDNNIQKVKDVLAGNFASVVKDAKFGPFFQSILTPEASSNLVVIDTHAAGIWLGKRMGAQSPEYKKERPDGAKWAAVNRDYTMAAQKVGLTPQSMQAVTWSVWRKLPPNYRVSNLQYVDDPVHPEADMFRALYPFLYYADEGKKQANWRYRYRIEQMQHLSPTEWRELVQQYGTDLYQYYGMQKKYWDMFLAKRPDWKKFLESGEGNPRAAVADLLDALADRISIQ